MQKFPSPFLPRRLRQLFGLSRHYARAQSGDFSSAGEWPAIRHIFEVLGINSGHVVDIAASDGVTQSCTLELFRNPHWSGLAVEMDPVKFAHLAYVYAGFKNSRLARCRVTPDNVVNLLQAYETPRDFDFLNLDIDSYDLFVIQQMLSSGFQPKIISMEINEKLPPPLFFTVLYDPAHYWKGDHFYGCSAVAAAQTVRPHGYVLAQIQYCNAIFVRADLAQNKIQDHSISSAYNDGYRDKPDRSMLFPWNADVDGVLEMNPQDALGFFSDFFEKYKGKFDLRISDV